MSFGELIKGKQFRIIFLSLCLGTGICILFYQQNRRFSNAFHRVVSNVNGIGSGSSLKDCSLLRFTFCGDSVNITPNNTMGKGNDSRLENSTLLPLHWHAGLENLATDEQDLIFNQFKELNDSYTLRLSQLKVVLYEDKKNFIKSFPPSRDMVSDTVGSHNMTVSSSNDTKFILLWTKFFGEEHWIRTSRFENCKSRCVITTKKDDLANSAAVIMHSRDMSGIQDLPKTRQQHQRWVYFVQESPPHISLKLHEFNGIWNTTSTYRSDSDLDGWYGRLRQRQTPIAAHVFQDQLRNILKSKQKLVAARISNCDSSSSSRIAYIRELQKYIKVDFYGACGDKKCPRQEKRCEADLMKQYKFTLAFENSNCRDYITEKLWEPLLTWQSVPVVMGGAGVEDYLRVAPPYSFIHTGGFESPKQLAEYLRFMNDHCDYYTLLHHWRQCYERTATRQEQSSWCTFCDLLHNSSAYGQSYTDFKGWYNQDICKHG